MIAPRDEISLDEVERIKFYVIVSMQSRRKSPLTKSNWRNIPGCQCTVLPNSPFCTWSGVLFSSGGIYCANSSSRALASLRSTVLNPSVNQP
jgi:hypothetical protein